VPTTTSAPGGLTRNGLVIWNSCDSLNGSIWNDKSGNNNSGSFLTNLPFSQSAAGVRFEPNAPSPLTYKQPLTNAPTDVWTMQLFGNIIANIAYSRNQDLWCKEIYSNGWDTVYTRPGGLGIKERVLFRDNAGDDLVIENPSDSIADSGSSGINQLITLVANANTDTLKLYVNGDLIGTDSGSINTFNDANTPLVFGWNADTDADGLNGNVKNLLLYNRELSLGEISANYNALLTSSCVIPPTTTLVPTTTIAPTTLVPTTLVPTTLTPTTTLVPTTLVPTTTLAPTTTTTPSTIKTLILDITGSGDLSLASASIGYGYFDWANSTEYLNLASSGPVTGSKKGQVSADLGPSPNDDNWGVIIYLSASAGYQFTNTNAEFPTVARFYKDGTEVGQASIINPTSLFQSLSTQAWGYLNTWNTASVSVHLSGSTIPPTTTLAPTTTTLVPTTIAPTTTTLVPTTTAALPTAFGGCGYGSSTAAACNDAGVNNRTLYSNCDGGSFGVGCIVYVDAAGNVPLTGYTNVFINSASWDINSSTGVITAYSSVQC
jgi:hypothetical protein